MTRSPSEGTTTPRSVVCSTCPPHDKFARPTCQVCYRVANGIDANPPAASVEGTTPPSLRELAASQFLELVRDYASALLNHPGTPRHTSKLNMVLEHEASLRAELESTRSALREAQEQIESGGRACKVRPDCATRAAAESTT